MAKIETEKAIRSLVSSNIKTFSETFSQRHISEIDNPEGVLNMKIHNVFIAALGEEFQYYTALARSFDSSLGNMLEKLAIGIAQLFYDVKQEVSGVLYPEQTAKIAELLEAYKNSKNPKKVCIADYREISNISSASTTTKVHSSDYYLYDKETNEHFLIELKIGGDLDNKKARSEKEAIFEQYAILSNKLGKEAKVKCFFATAYNRFGEGKPWKQGRVRQFFSEKELLIGRDFWDFVCKSNNGYNIVIDELNNNAHYLVAVRDMVSKQKMVA